MDSIVVVLVWCLNCISLDVLLVYVSGIVPTHQAVMCDRCLCARLWSLVRSYDIICIRRGDGGVLYTSL